jgi:hypothetical protein
VRPSSLSGSKLSRILLPILTVSLGNVTASGVTAFNVVFLGFRNGDFNTTMRNKWGIKRRTNRKSQNGISVEENGDLEIQRVEERVREWEMFVTFGIGKYVLVKC